MKTRFTPGPWFAVNDGTALEPMMVVKAARIAGKPPRHEVAIVAIGDSPQEMEDANAFLIAAAPELLEMLERMIDQGERCNWFGDRLDEELVAEARQLIAKARGAA
jgi:hypothetical protein